MTFYCSTRACSWKWRNVRRRQPLQRCHACGEPLTALRPVPNGAAAYVLKDFPEHYNWSMGCHVKSRAHHRQLQKERGLRDWEPVRESPMLSKLRKQGYL